MKLTVTKVRVEIIFQGHFRDSWSLFPGKHPDNLQQKKLLPYHLLKYQAPPKSICLPVLKSECTITNTIKNIKNYCRTFLFEFLSLLLQKLSKFLLFDCKVTLCPSSVLSCTEQLLILSCWIWKHLHLKTAPHTCSECGRSTLKVSFLWSLDIICMLSFYPLCGHRHSRANFIRIAFGNREWRNYIQTNWFSTADRKRVVTTLLIGAYLLLLIIAYIYQANLHNKSVNSRVEVLGWIFARNTVNAVNFFVRNAVKAAKKITAFHRISYKISAHLLSNAYWIWLLNF